jgi:hypothetical protein
MTTAGTPAADARIVSAPIEACSARLHIRIVLNDGSSGSDHVAADRDFGSDHCLAIAVIYILKPSDFDPLLSVAYGRFQEFKTLFLTEISVSAFALHRHIFPVGSNPAISAWLLDIPFNVST